MIDHKKDALTTPEGFVLVPREPTEEMCDVVAGALIRSGYDLNGGAYFVSANEAAEVYRAMLAAAPAAPAGVEQSATSALSKDAVNSLIRKKDSLITGLRNENDRLKRMLAAPQPEAREAGPVAVVGANYALFWIGDGPIAPIIEKHGIKVGDKLYAAPKSATEPLTYCCCGECTETGGVPALRPEEEAEQFIQAAIDNAPEPLRRLGEYLTRVLDEDHWPTAEQLLLGIATSQQAAPAADESRAAANICLCGDPVEVFKNEQTPIFQAGCTNEQCPGYFDQTINQGASRAAFEAAFEGEVNLERLDNGRYAWVGAATRWQAWQACARTLARPVEVKE